MLFWREMVRVCGVVWVVMGSASEAVLAAVAVAVVVVGGLLVRGDGRKLNC